MGASSGIGRAVAETLASRGVRLGIAARTESALREIKEKYPDNVEYELIDINSPLAVHRMLNLIERLGGMDIYLHASGIGYTNPSLDPELEARTVETDCSGFARMVMTAFRYYLDQGKEGTIAAITSVAGTHGIGEMAAYSASKRFDSTYLSALRQLANRRDLPIHVTDIKPGWIRTPLLDSEKSYPMEMTLEEIVPHIIKAMVRHPRVTVIDTRWAILTALWSKLPSILWEHMDISIQS